MDSSQDKVVPEDVPKASPSLILMEGGALVLQMHQNGTMQLSMSNTTAKPAEITTTAGHLSLDDQNVLYMVNNTKSSTVIPFVATTPGPATTTPLLQVIVQGNHRVELEPIDFQMNSTKNATTKVNVVITVIVTA
ncbi:hypothetical protein RvY_06320 [Ramazzottius varieornatus]|uniref:Uncharacterized protein n=1 Tax=Ramazzottius varieornatus TaxID=947166 RepID=A0A1D1V4J4_RAMVA|nr:hypothetical protein RvY_06320 [Ramazzottius varieornatus]